MICPYKCNNASSNPTLGHFCLLISCRRQDHSNSQDSTVMLRTFWNVFLNISTDLTVLIIHDITMATFPLDSWMLYFYFCLYWCTGQFCILYRFKPQGCPSQPNNIFLALSFQTQYRYMSKMCLQSNHATDSNLFT